MSSVSTKPAQSVEAASGQPVDRSATSSASRAGMHTERLGNAIMTALRTLKRPFGAANTHTAQASTPSSADTLSVVPSAEHPSSRPNLRSAAFSRPTSNPIERIPALLLKLGNINDEPLRPAADKSLTRSGRTKFEIGERTFFVCTLPVQLEGKQARKLDVIVERGYRDDPKKTKQAFFPLDRDLNADTSTELYKKANGEWGVLGGKPIVASPRWLNADAFDNLARYGDSVGFHSIGAREFCVASVMTGPNRTHQSHPLMIERHCGSIPGNDRYTLLNADLSEGEPVEQVDGASGLDPFMSELLAHIDSRGWRPGEGQELINRAH